MSKQQEVEALKNLRSGTARISFPSLFLNIMFFTLVLYGNSISPLIVLFVEIVFGMLGADGASKLSRGFRDLRRIGIKVDEGRTGSGLYVVGFLISFFGSFSSIFSWNSTSVTVGLGIQTFAGILIGIGINELGKIYNEEVLRTGGVIASVPLASFIGYIIAYSGFIRVEKRIMRAIEQEKKPPVTSSESQTSLNNPTENQITQVGQGIIEFSGYARVSIYSPVSAEILSAKIQGTNLESRVITPSNLEKGINEVSIFFGNVSVLKPNETYIITVSLLIERKVININTQATYISRIFS